MVYILFLLAFVALGVGIWLLSGDTQATNTHANHDQPRRTTPSWSGLRRGQNTARRTWAEAKGFSFAKTDSTLVGQWQRGAASTGGAPRDIATGRSHHWLRWNALTGLPFGGLTRARSSDLWIRGCAVR